MSRRKSSNSGNNEPTAPFWLLTYGDVMTLLLTFFVLLLSFSSVQEAKFKQAMGALQAALGVLPSSDAVMDELPPRSDTEAESDEAQEVEEKIAEVVELLQGAGLDNRFDVIATSDGYAIRLSSPVLFDLASAHLSAPGGAAIAKLAQHLQKTDSAMRVEGHTDNVPIHTTEFPSNWELSTARALSVLRLMNENGVASTRLSAAGYGEFKPLLPNDTEEHRDANRRVEVYVKVKKEESRIRAEDLMWR